MGGPSRKDLERKRDIKLAAQAKEISDLLGSESGITKRSRAEFTQRFKEAKAVPLGGRGLGGEGVARGKALEKLRIDVAAGVAGEGKFGERQALQKRVDLLRDRPGRSQLLG